MTPGRFAVLLGLLVVAAFPDVLLKGLTFTIRDFGMFSYPVAYYQRQAFWRGELPQWNPLNYCGVPFLAQWNTMVFYPGALIYLLLPLPWSLSFFCLAHLFWGGLGMFYLARRWTNNSLAAALAGILFSFNGLTLNFLMWPSHIATFSWFPWVVWLAPLGWQQGGRKLYWAVGAGAMQMLAGGPETILLTWIFLFLLACGDCLAARTRRCLPPLHHSITPLPRQLALRFIGIVSLVALICAAQLLPFLELVAHSQRDRSFGAISANWAMSFWGLGNFLVPLFHTISTSQHITFPMGQYWTSSCYAGVAALFLSAIAVWREPSPRVRLLAIVASLSLLLSLGDAGLLYRGLRFLLPQIGFVRYPVKFVILVSALLPLLAGIGFAALLRSKQGLSRFEWSCAIALLALIALIIGMEKRYPLMAVSGRNTLQNGAARAAFFLLSLLSGWAVLSSKGRRRILFGGLLLTITWLDLATHEPKQNPTIPPLACRPGIVREQTLANPLPALGQGRVILSPAADSALRYNSLPNLEQDFLVDRWAAFADSNLLDAIPQVDGFFSLDPGRVGYLASLPFVQTNHDFSTILDFMGVSGTTRPGMVSDWMVRPSAMPLVTAGQEPVFASDRDALDALVQTNTNPRQTVFLPRDVKGLVSAKACPKAHVLHAAFENERVQIEATAPTPSLILISQSWYPAWRAYIDGKPTKLWRANYAFQAVQMPAGHHVIELAYQDRAFQIGVLLSLIGCSWFVLGMLARGNFHTGPEP